MMEIIAGAATLMETVLNKGNFTCESEEYR